MKLYVLEIKLMEAEQQLFVLHNRHVTSTSNILIARVKLFHYVFQHTIIINLFSGAASVIQTAGSILLLSKGYDSPVLQPLCLQL